MEEKISPKRIDWIRFRSVAEDYFRRNISFEACYEQMKITYGGIYPERDTLYRWERAFRESGNIVYYIKAPGAPQFRGLATQILPLIEQNSHISLRRMAEIINRSRQTIANVITRDLKLIRVSIRWIPHILSRSNLDERIDASNCLISHLWQIQKIKYAGFVTGDETWLYLDNPSNSQWIDINESRPTAPRKAIGAQKVMLTVFFGADRIWLIHAMPQKKSVTSITFINDILTPLLQSVRSSNPELKQIYVHFDNASSHNSHATTQFLEENKIIRVAHPPYSPDLSPCGYFLFGYLKRILQGNTFKTVEEAVDAASKILYSIPKNMLYSCFENWRTRA
ncbi:MAG: putative Mariner Mos1 transposase, partial [Streblomastix strix]